MLDSFTRWTTKWMTVLLGNRRMCKKKLNFPLKDNDVSAQATVTYQSNIISY